jgi:nicotinate-nucleotide adenylyltransferase
MLRAAVEGEPGFSVDPREIEGEGPSYSILTARAYAAEHPRAALFFFIGEDNLEELHSWHEIEELKRLVRFVVLARGGSPLPIEFPRIGRRIELNSTEIRNRVARGFPIRYMTPVAVCNIIESERLYLHA